MEVKVRDGYLRSEEDVRQYVIAHEAAVDRVIEEIEATITIHSITPVQEGLRQALILVRREFGRDASG